jgi:GAF domain-containing protein/HAMP domain-containing protein
MSVGIIAYYLSQDALRNEAFSELEAVRNLKANQIQTYFEGVDQDIRLTAKLSNVHIASFELSNYIATFGLDEIRELGFLGRPDLDGADSYHWYRDRHKLYHPFFREIVQAKGYEDIFLVSPGGDVVYSYAKRDDFATNLVDGPYSSTLLGQLFQELQNNSEAGQVLMSDYATYPPAENSPISFVGTPLVDPDIGVVGVLIYALSLEQISQVVEDNAGLDTVESYLVDADGMKRSGTGLMREQVNNIAVKQGLQGISSAKAIWNGQQTMFTAYQPLKISDLNWVLITEEAEDHALAGADRVGFWMVIGIIGAIVLVIIAGFVVGFRIVNPISRLTYVARQVIGGNLKAKAKVESQDEIGELSEAFNTMTDQLGQSIGTLEQEVQERTAELVISLEVGQRVATIRDMDVLLSTVTEFIWEQFNLYYAQIFLVDDINKNLVLRYGTGQSGKEFMARNFSLPIDEDTTVGRSVIQRRSIIVGDTSLGSFHVDRQIPASWYAVLLNKEKEKRPESLLPESLSELALPLIVEDQVLGVLNLQDNKTHSFTEKDLSVYESIAVQLSISIDSARQWELAQQAHQRAEMAVQQLTREAWSDRLVASRGEEGFVYDLSNVVPLSKVSWASEESMSVPLVVQDQPIGQLAVRAGNKKLTENEQVLLQSVAQQLAQKAENLRLFEVTRQRASREQIARQIIDKVRASRNIEMALRTATEELNRALGTVRTSIDLQIAPPSQQVDDASKTEDTNTLNRVEPPTPANGKQGGETLLDLGENRE